MPKKPAIIGGLLFVSLRANLLSFPSSRICRRPWEHPGTMQTSCAVSLHVSILIATTGV
jgi:hypothetical protein